MKVNTFRFYILVAFVSFSLMIQVFVPVKVEASIRSKPSKPIAKRHFSNRQAKNPVLFAAMAAIERSLNGVPEFQKTQFDRIVDSALQKYPNVSRDSLRQVVATWKQLPIETKEAIDFPALLAISFDNLRATNPQNQTDPPILYAVNPKELTPGQTQEVTLVGRNFTPDMKIQFGEGVQIVPRRAAKMVGSYQMTLFVTVAANAQLSDRQISVSNNFGASKHPLAVSIKKQTFIPARLVSGWGFLKFNNQTELMTWNGMPADGSVEFPFIYGKSGFMIPSNSVNWHLRWTNNVQKATQAQWQVSVYPLTQDTKNWRTPPGLIGHGLVKSAPAMGDYKRLDINLAPVVKRIPGSDVYAADAINIKRPDEIVVKQPVRTQPTRQDRTVVKPDQTIVKQPVVITRKPPVGKVVPIRVKPQIRPSTLVNMGKRRYYVRLVPLDATGNIAGAPSTAVEVVYEPNPPEQQPIKFASTETVTCQSPQARIKGYEPIRSRRTDSQYWFLVISPPPDMIASVFGWKVGDHLFLPPKEDSKDFWDYVGDAIGGVIDFVANVVNLISAAWNEIKGAVVGAFVNFLKGIQIGCPEWCETGLKMGLDAGLVAIGIPPNIPNFNELQNMGADYLAETIAAEVLAASPIPLPKEELKKAAKAALTEMTNQVNQTASGGMWIMHDNTADPRPAYLMIQVFNPTNTATDAGYAYVNEGYRVFKLNKNLPVPALQPGESVDIPVVLEPDLDLPDGIPTSVIQYEGWWNRYAMNASFSFGAGCGCPGATPPGYDMTNPSQHIILCDPKGGNSDKLQVKAMETWGNP